ncbi:MAG: reductive dehalogenase [Proteobacteria bacterium]|nr:reductive dehalogenase [Pseudomonadota bacterium]
MKTEKGAERYVVGSIERFDQKNEMFKRAMWDPQVAEIGTKFYIEATPPKAKAGYRLDDQSMVNASWHLDNKFGVGGNGELYAWDWNGKYDYPRVPEGCRVDNPDPVRLSREIKLAARFFGAAKVGICKLDRRWLYSSYYYMTREGITSGKIDLSNEYAHAIVVGIEMDYDAIGTSPAHPASVATGYAYSEMAKVSAMVAQFIRGMGFRAIPSGNDTACSIPIAIDAGFGELARNGLLITPEFGPRIRLAKVFTDMPLVPDKPIRFGAWEFCRICGKCAEQCPSKSIMFGDPCPTPINISNRSGVLKWHIDAESCLKWWSINGTDCSNCIRVCPFNKPPGKLHDLVRWGIRTLPSLNPLFIWGDDFMKYGEKRNPEDFWYRTE